MPIYCRARSRGELLEQIRTSWSMAFVLGPRGGDRWKEYDRLKGELAKWDRPIFSEQTVAKPKVLDSRPSGASSQGVSRPGMLGLSSEQQQERR